MKHKKTIQTISELLKGMSVGPSWSNEEIEDFYKLQKKYPFKSQRKISEESKIKEQK